MKTRNFFVAKLVAVTIMLGFFSPSINIQEVAKPTKLASAATLDISQGLLAKLSNSEFTVTLFTQAEARKRKRARRSKARRRAVRKGHRRANYRHHRKRERRRNVLGAVVVGAVVGAALNN